MSYFVQEFVPGRGGKWWTMRRVDTLADARGWANVSWRTTRIITIHHGKFLHVPKHENDCRKPE